MIKKAIGLLAGIAIIGGVSFDQIQKFLDQSEQITSKVIAQAKLPDFGKSGKTENSKKNNSKKMRLEIPAFLTDRPEEVIWHDGYTVSFNRRTKIPNWVAWELTKARTEGTVSRSDDFQPDPDVKKGSTAEDSDYRGSGYDRGHMCPAADNKYSEQAMTECFYFSNMCPQLHSLNGGDWKELEEKCHKWARKYESIYIVCGPIVYSSYPKTIGQNKITVPDAFYKVIMRQDKDGDAKAIGYVFKHKKQNKPLKEYAVSVDEVEELTGIDFFSKLPDDVEDKMEASFNVYDWQ